MIRLRRGADGSYVAVGTLHVWLAKQWVELHDVHFVVAPALQSSYIGMNTRLALIRELQRRTRPTHMGWGNWVESGDPLIAKAYPVRVNGAAAGYAQQATVRLAFDCHWTKGDTFYHLKEGSAGRLGTAARGFRGDDPPVDGDGIFRKEFFFYHGHENYLGRTLLKEFGVFWLAQPDFFAGSSPDAADGGALLTKENLRFKDYMLAMLEALAQNDPKFGRRLRKLLNSTPPWWETVP